MPHKEDNFFEAPMKKLALLLVVVSLFIASPVWAESTWKYKVQKDKMSGETADYIVGNSKNKLAGWIGSSYVYFFVVCKTTDIHVQVTEIHNSLGVTLIKMGRLEKAIEHFSTAVNINPGFEEAKRNLNAGLLLRERQ